VASRPMGCSQSRERFDKASERFVDVQPESLPVVPGSTSLSAPALYAIQKALFRERKEAVITQADGKVIYKQLKPGEKEGDWRDMMVYTDIKGKKMAALGRDIVFPASHAKFTIYSYTPNFEGQESVEVDYDGVKLYPFALLRCVIPSIPPKYEYLMYKTSNDKPELVSIVNSVCSSIKRGTMSDRNGHPMLKFEEAKENGHIDIEVAKGTDPLQAIAIGISIDEETTRSK